VDRFLLPVQKQYYGRGERARIARSNLDYYQKYAADHGDRAKLIRGGSLILVTDLIVECVADILEAS
jgi:hypothetical protein